MGMEMTNYIKHSFCGCGIGSCHIAFWSFGVDVNSKYLLSVSSLSHNIMSLKIFRVVVNGLVADQKCQ